MQNRIILFADFTFTNLNDSLTQLTFPSLLKLANVTPVHKIATYYNVFTGILWPS